MSSSVDIQPDTQQPMDSIIYSSFVNKFNEEYSESLNEGQKTLLGKYISSFTDNDLELKIYLNEEIGRLKEELGSIQAGLSATKDDAAAEKVKQVYEILSQTKNKEIDTETLEVVLNTQGLLEEIDKNDDWYKIRTRPKSWTKS